MLEKLRNNPRIVVVALIAAGVLAIAVAAGNNKSATPQTTPESAENVSQPDSENKDDENKDNEEASNDEQSTTPAAGDASTSPSVVSQGTANVEVRSEAGAYKSVVKSGNNQTVVVRKMIADYLASKSETLSDEQKLFVETNIVTLLPRKDRIYPGEEISVTEEVMSKTIEASKQLTQEQIKRWSAYL